MPSRILNFGSLNIDHVYSVERFVRPGETLAAAKYAKYCGGKGFNQSVALAHAGARVTHAGKIGEDGIFLRKRLEAAGVDASLVEIVDVPTGHAIIQVTAEGENSIILHGGANRTITRGDAEKALRHFSPGDLVLLQNEISSVPDIMEMASKKELRIAFNPSPIDATIKDYPLHLVDLFVLNEIEGGELTGAKKPETVLTALRADYPKAAFVLTLGGKGAVCASGSVRASVPALKVTAVDTTAAGDTFTGFFLAEWAAGVEVEHALKTACRAAAICVTRPGAADSIPTRAELLQWTP